MLIWASTMASIIMIAVGLWPSERDSNVDRGCGRLPCRAGYLVTRGMQWLNGSYACYFSKRHRKIAHFFGERYKASTSRPRRT